MSTYLGFEPTDKCNYFFVSYNTEDADRVKKIVKNLVHRDVPIWYDHGLEYGEQWEAQIPEKIRNAQAVLLFFSRGILQKKQSYVKKEYDLATGYYDKKVVVIFLDSISKAEIPDEKLFWWLDIRSKQNIIVQNYTDSELLNRAILKSIGNFDEAEAYFNEYLYGKSIKEKACVIGHTFDKRLLGLSYRDEWAQNTQCAIDLLRHTGNSSNKFDLFKQFCIDGITFSVGHDWVFHRGAWGDECVLWLWRNQELIAIIGGLIEAGDVEVFYDQSDDYLYICYESEKEDINHEGTLQTSVAVIENPTGEARITDFRFIFDE